jgi:ABC-type uncharacterized transport system substrate-binding protein
MPRLRALLILLLASGVLLGTDWLLRQRSRTGGAHGRKGRISFIQYLHVPEVEEAEAGVREGLRKSGLVEGQDYEVIVRNANGDMPTINGLIDAALGDGTDLILTFSTPALQAALRKVERVPVVFTFLADPIAAGAGRSEREHKANVTGVYTHAAYDEILGAARACVPGLRKVGTLFVPAETNSAFHNGRLHEAARRKGIGVVALPLSSTSDVPDTAAALCGRDVDAICLVGGNLTIASFPSIASAARRARLPIIGSVSSQKGGSVVVVARDYHDAGRDAAGLAARVLRGESPGDIPFQPTRRTRLIVNKTAARECGVDLPASLLGRASEVLE